MGKLVYVGIVNEKTVTIRNSPINAALAVLAYIEDGSDTEPRWVIQIWDTTAMGEKRLEPIGHVYGVGKPTISSVRQLGEMSDNYIQQLG